MGLNDVMEFYRTFFKGNRFNMLLLKLLLVVVVAFFVIVTYKSLTEPVKILGIELNQNKAIHDTIIIRDTIRIPQESIARSSDKSEKNSKSNLNQVVKGDNSSQINITSNEQSGGQTAGQINN